MSSPEHRTPSAANELCPKCRLPVVYDDVDERDPSWVCHCSRGTSAAYVDLLAAAKRVTRAYTAEAEDWNDGEFALWQKDDLVVALVELRKLVGHE